MTERITLERGEYIGLAEAERRFGLSYSTARLYISSGRLPARRGPGRKLFVAVRDVEALFKPVKPQPTQKD